MQLQMAVRSGTSMTLERRYSRRRRRTMAAPELAASKLPQAQASGHRIVDVTAHCLRLPYRGEVQFARMKQASAEYSIVVITLDDGTEGIAEAVCRPEFTGEDSRSIAYMIDTFFKPMVVGADPLHHLTILDRLERIRDCRAAKSLIDIALWDLRGKLLGEPVWRLHRRRTGKAGPADLGGARQYPRGDARGSARDGARARLQGPQAEGVEALRRGRRAGARRAPSGRRRNDALCRREQQVHRVRGQDDPVEDRRLPCRLHRGPLPQRRTSPAWRCWRRRCRSQSSATSIATRSARCRRISPRARSAASA